MFKNYLGLLFCMTSLMLWSQNEFHLEENYPVRPGGKIYLQSNDAEVSIVGSNRKDVSLNIYRKVKVRGIRLKEKQSFTIAVKEEDGNLYIKEKRGDDYTVVIGSISKEYTISLEVPQYINLDLSGDDDHYFISNINGNISIKAEDPYVEIRQVKGDQFQFEIDDGEIFMDRGQGSLTFISDDGDLTVSEGHFNRINAHTEDGDISIATHLVDVGHYIFEMEDGDMILDILSGGGAFKIEFDDCYIEYDEDYQIIKEKEHELYLKSRGDAEISIEAEDGSIRIINRFSNN